MITMNCKRIPTAKNIEAISHKLNLQNVQPQHEIQPVIINLGRCMIVPTATFDVENLTVKPNFIPYAD